MNVTLSFGTLAAGILVAAGCVTTAPHGPDPGLEGARETRVRLPPFVWWTRSADGASEVRNFLGFLYGQRAESAEPVPSSPDDFVVSRNSLRILWPFYYRDSLVRADGIRTETRSLLPFVWTKHKSESSGRGADYFQRRVVVPPLLFSLRSDNYGSGQIEYEFLWPLGRYFRGERTRHQRREMARSFRFIPFVAYERTWAADPRGGLRAGDRASVAEAAVPGRRPGERVRVSVLKPLFGYDRDLEARRKRAYLLGGIAGYGAGKSGERTLGLLAAETGPATDYEIQALWQFFMVKRSGAGEFSASCFAPERPSDMWRATKWLFGGSPRKIFKLGPLLSYRDDWSEDRKEFSILFGLISYSRSGKARRGRFLWIIPWRP